MGIYIFVLVLVIFINMVSSIAYASAYDTIDINQIAYVSASQTLKAENEHTVKAKAAVVINEKEFEDLAGILYKSLFYNRERRIEQLQVGITQGNEKPSKPIRIYG